MKVLAGTTGIRALVIKCSTLEFDLKRMRTYLKIKARLSTSSSVILAVEDAGTYKFYLLRDLFYFPNIKNNGITEKPFTLSWNELPEPVTYAQLEEAQRKEVADFLNSDEGLDKGWTFALITNGLNAHLPYCQRFYVNPESTSPRTALKTMPDRNPFLRNATVGEIVREMQRRGYSVQYSTEQEDQCSPS